MLGFRRWYRGDAMKRREFIGLIGSAIAWPPAAGAQQKNRAYRIAVLLGGSPANSPNVDIIEKSFRELGWSPGRDLEIEYRWGAGDTERNNAHAKEIISTKPDAVLAMTNSAMAALHREASGIPTVFVMVSDPVGMRYVDSFAHPGRNITGFTPFDPSLGAKWVSLLKEIAPNIENVGLIYNPEPGNNLASFAGPIEAVAPSLGVKSIVKPVGDSTGIERLISTLGGKSNSGLIFLPDAFTAVHSEAIVAAVAQHRLPAIYPLRLFCGAGGLISYGVNSSELLQQGVSYVSRILRGTKPADLPVQAPTKFELVINLKAAKAMGLVLPPSLIALADDVIE
ncbi:MAG TPA: ABC transporter substrate-binding protein [Bradyrhizobium sp.]|jgi:putative ABC transport system substrate-binding protein|nr:ABC transporter substrate-binding protein [Bradyrhizobium sp.]